MFVMPCFEVLCVKGGTFLRPFTHGLFEGADLKGWSLKSTNGLKKVPTIRN